MGTISKCSCGEWVNSSYDHTCPRDSSNDNNNMDDRDYDYHDSTDGSQYGPSGD